jgi:hypothetical protein
VSESLDLTIVYEDGEDGWVVASIPEVKGVHSQGRTREEARTNVIDALKLMLSPTALTVIAGVRCGSRSSQTSTETSRRSRL